MNTYLDQKKAKKIDYEKEREGEREGKKAKEMEITASSCRCLPTTISLLMPFSTLLFLLVRFIFRRKPSLSSSSFFSSLASFFFFLHKRNVLITYV